MCACAHVCGSVSQVTAPGVRTQNEVLPHHRDLPRAAPFIVTQLLSSPTAALATADLFSSLQLVRLYECHHTVWGLLRLTSVSVMPLRCSMSVVCLFISEEPFLCGGITVNTDAAKGAGADSYGWTDREGIIFISEEQLRSVRNSWITLGESGVLFQVQGD